MFIIKDLEFPIYIFYVLKISLPKIRNHSYPFLSFNLYFVTFTNGMHHYLG